MYKMGGRISSTQCCEGYIKKKKGTPLCAADSCKNTQQIQAGQEVKPKPSGQVEVPQTQGKGTDGRGF